MSSVASDPTSIFPVSRPLPAHRTAAPEQSGQSADPFAALLEHEPAQPPRAKQADAKRRGDAAPSEDSRRSDAAKHTKDKDDAKVGGSNPEATQAHAETDEASKDAATTAEASSEPSASAAKNTGETNPEAAETNVTATEGTALIDAAALLVPVATPAAAATAATPVVATLDIASVIAPGAAPGTVPAPEAQGATPVSAEIAAGAANVAKPAPAARADKPAAAPSTTPGGDSKPGPATLPDVALPKAEVPAAARAAAVAKPTFLADAKTPDSNGALKTAGEVLQNLGLAVPAAQTGAAPAQSTAAASAAAAAAPAQPSSTPVPVASLAVELVAQALAGKHRFEIRLDPPELGRIDVRLEIDRDGNVTSRLVVERAETLDMLRRDAPQLERALQQAGLKTADNALEFSLRQQTPERHDDVPGRGPRLATEDTTAASIDAVQINYGRRLGLGGGLDIRV